MIVVIMGVSGSGKTTIGTMLADAIRCRFLEGDSLHSKENIEKMSHGIPLTDSDRAPWLTAIRAHILKFFERREDLVVACSALEQKYREVLAEGIPITWVYLKGSAELIRSRMKHRPRHFMKAGPCFPANSPRWKNPLMPSSSTFHSRPLPSWRRSSPGCGDHSPPFRTMPPLKRHKKSGCLGEECETYPCLSKRTLQRSNAKQGGSE
jgi:gluconokinase